MKPLLWSGGNRQQPTNFSLDWFPLQAEIIVIIWYYLLKKKNKLTKCWKNKNNIVTSAMNKNNSVMDNMRSIYVNVKDMYI